MSKTIILLQIGNITNLDMIIKFLEKYINAFNYLIVSILRNISDSVDENMFTFVNQHIMYHENRGMDIGPFLLQMKWLNENIDINDNDQILKIHTKNNRKWLYNLLQFDNFGIIKASSLYMINMDILNREHIFKICEQCNIPNIYYDDIDENYDNYILDVEWYSDYYNVTINNCSIDITEKYIRKHAKINNHAINEKQIIVKRRHNCKFVGGTIFSIDANTLCKFIKMINIDELYVCLETGYIKNDHSTYTHALERIISSFFN